MSESERMPICQLLEWDTNFFGMRIARLLASSLSSYTADRAESWCAENRIDCLYFLAGTQDPETILLAERYQYSLVDIRMTLGWRLHSRAAVVRQDAAREIRPARADDIGMMKEIAGDIYTDTRFYFDRRFPRALCARLYETWIEESCNGYAETVLVAQHQGQPAGYITCHVYPEHGQIGLLGISPNARKLGFGASLIHAAVDWFAAHDLKYVTVVTQGRNIAAQRLYQQCGFLTEKCELWYHRWFNPPAGTSE
jgi:ribosomal protein S18 acetylase RimI-like enzyme